MDQVQIGAFLKSLRKEKGLTQERLAECLRVSNRTISRWETGSNLPDISMLAELAAFYEVSIPEIIAGERKSETMNQETKETAAAMAEYGRNEVKRGKRNAVGVLAAAFGIFTMISAFVVFPSDSSWGSIYASLGGILLLAGVACLPRTVLRRRSRRILALLGCAVLLSGVFLASDYIAVAQFHQVPRFRYLTGYDSRYPDQLVYRTLFFTAVQKHPGTPQETVEIVK